MPAAYLFQSKIMSKDPREWITGSLVSECLAKITLEELRQAEIDPVFDEICNRTLEDEARHLGFNHVFREDQFLARYSKKAEEGDALADRLLTQLEEVLTTVPPILEALHDELTEVGVDVGWLNEELRTESRRRLERSIEGWRAGHRNRQSLRATAVSRIGLGSSAAGLTWQF